MKKIAALLLFSFYLFLSPSFGQSSSPSFQTFINPVIPGDHPDPTLTKIGDYFYSSGSSFNPTPKLYRSTNLVHWEVIAQPVTSDWVTYGNNPGGGAWGGHTVLYNGLYWHYFGRGGGLMYFVTANDPAGPWSYPTSVNIPTGLSGLGVDNSIFIDEDTNRWFLLTKAGQGNNHMVELGTDGQPSGNVLDLTWLNPASEDYPYAWAEGPVMWKHNDYYYYSFAEHLVGVQYVMRSKTITDDPEAWEILDDVMFYGTRGNFQWPNHISPAVTLDDGTSWAIGHSYHNGDWYGQGRQGLLHQITYDENDWPRILFPTNEAEQAPNLPSSGIPWMVPKSDMFEETSLHPEWSFLGYTQSNHHSLTRRPGWLYLEPRIGNNDHTVIKNDGEHQYSLITRVDFQPESPTEEAGLWIFNGPETHQVKVYSSVNDDGTPIAAFSFENEYFEEEHTIGSDVWLKLMRNGHNMTGFYSSNGHDWIQIGGSVNAIALGREQTDFNDFTGNQQGLYVKERPAYFNMYIYRDAYSRIGAQYPANSSGVRRYSSTLALINNNDWALYAGVEFGNDHESASYQRKPIKIQSRASSQTSGSTIEVWLDSIDTGNKIAVIGVEQTASLSSYETFTADITEEISGRHDVYLRFRGNEGENLMQLQSFWFLSEQHYSTDAKPETAHSFKLNQNYPNPFNPTTQIEFSLPLESTVSLTVFDITGRKVTDLIHGKRMSAGTHTILFDASGLSSGVYLYRLNADGLVQTKRMTVIK